MMANLSRFSFVAKTSQSSLGGFLLLNKTNKEQKEVYYSKGGRTMFETKQTTSDNRDTKGGKGKFKLSSVIIVLLFLLVVGMGSYIFYFDGSPTDLAPTDLEEIDKIKKPLVTDKDQNNDTGKEEAKVLTSNFFSQYDMANNEYFAQYLTGHTDLLSSLAIGFTTMASFLDSPETIVTVDEIKRDMTSVQGVYEDIFLQLDPVVQDNLDQEAQEAVTKLIADYRLMFSWRLEQALGLKTTPQGVEIEYQTVDNKTVVDLWADIVLRHADYKTITGLDYTGGLGVLMK